MNGWLIDGVGELWPDTSSRLRAALWSRLPPMEFCRFAITSLGFAHIGESQHGLRISWRPTTLTGETFAGLIMALDGRSNTRIAIATLVADWSYEVLPSLAAAKRELIHTFRSATCDREGHFLARRRRPETLRLGEHLAQLLAEATLTGLTITPIDLWTLLQRSGDRRYVLVHSRNDNEPFEVLAWGGGYQRFREDWASSMAGQLFDNQPDRAYARRAAVGYREAMRTGEPIVEDVETSTWWPGRGRTRFTYTRLVLPIRVAGKGLCILSSSQDAVRVDARLETGHKGR